MECEVSPFGLWVRRSEVMSEVRFVKRGKTPKQKSEKTKISPQKRNLTEEASDKNRAKSSGMLDDFSDDNFQMISNSSNTFFEQNEVVKDI
ncbi:hypothetical protein TNCV_2803481 [Trichonephila clavipes]|nr:hypothetical protein TNCV_2803481 [Trichonephila clavipes]